MHLQLVLRFVNKIQDTIIDAINIIKLKGEVLLCKNY